jgi:acetamidase/formamidase
MTTYHIEPTRETLHGHFSRDLPPILTVQSGDTVVYRLLDAAWHIEPRTSPHWEDSPAELPGRDPEKDKGHALCGPVYIADAKPGMTLEVRINELVPASWGWTGAGYFPHPVNDRLGFQNDGAFLWWRMNEARTHATDYRGVEVALRPFLGVMGMPPDKPGIHSTAPPRITGGNLDCKELVAGTRLFLPIAVEGGLFSCGDGHARQGDGESSVMAIEAGMDRASLTFHLHETDAPLAMPRAWTPEGWLTLGVHEDLQEATYLALDAMLTLMDEQYPGLRRAEALAYASVAVDLRVTQIVNGVRGVHAVLPHDALKWPVS